MSKMTKQMHFCEILIFARKKEEKMKKTKMRISNFSNKHKIHPIPDWKSKTQNTPHPSPDTKSQNTHIPSATLWYLTVGRFRLSFRSLKLSKVWIELKGCVTQVPLVTNLDRLANVLMCVRGWVVERAILLRIYWQSFELITRSDKFAGLLENFKKFIFFPHVDPEIESDTTKPWTVAGIFHFFFLLSFGLNTLVCVAAVVASSQIRKTLLFDKGLLIILDARRCGNKILLLCC